MYISESKSSLLSEMKLNFRAWTKKRLYAALRRLEFTKRIIASKIIIHNLLKEKDLRRVCIRNIICHNKKFKADSGSSPLRYNPLLHGRLIEPLLFRGN